MASKVFYMDARSTLPQESLVAKMLTVFEAAGFDRIIKPRDMVAIKVHCGEWNNTNYLRPVYARAIADRVKELGGRPFVCDTTTLTYGINASRATELDLLTTAERNGYSPAVLGCPFICADGFMGMDDYRVDLPEGYILGEAFIARAIASADVLITLTHFKGHGLGIIGGSVKNLGIGAQSKRGKFNVHMGGHPRYGVGMGADFHPEAFKGKKADPNWKTLEECCPYDLIHIVDDRIVWEREKCCQCIACLGPMTSRGIIVRPETNYTAANAAIADACLATIKAVGPGKVAFINLAIDVGPGCDCVNFGDIPMVPHLGVFASFDPVAIDKACVDKARQAHGVPTSKADDLDIMGPGTRKFETGSAAMSGMCEEIQLNTGELNGLGSKQYELIEVPRKKMEDFAFPPDPRPIGIRLREKFAKSSPFPYERFDGQGFMRAEEVDLERVNTYDEDREAGKDKAA